MLISRITASRKYNWSIIDLEAGAIVWVLKRLHPYVFSIPFKISQTTTPLCTLPLPVNTILVFNFGWRLWLLINKYTLKHNRGTADSSADFVLRLPQAAMEKNISKAYRLPYPEDGDVSFGDVSGLWPCIPRNLSDGIPTPR